MASNPESALFTQAANNYLRQLHLAHARNLSTGADGAIRANTHAAKVVRRAVVVHSAINEICSIPSEARSDALEVSCGYLRGAAARMQAALRDADIQTLNTLTTATESVLDDLGERNAFEQVEEVEFDEGTPDIVKKRSLFKRDTPSNIDPDDVTKRNRSFCGLSCAELSRRDKLVLWLYFFMCIGAIVAVTAVTVDFARQQINPGAFIQSDVSDSLPAPVITVCLSQPGIPFSRLQLFNFTDAEGGEFRGADPAGVQTKRQGPRFESAVERFWENPRGENCDKKVGDFFPFPLESLNRLITGEDTTECRPCYRVGSKLLATARSTSFQDSSVLAFWTDNYFLQCMKSAGGLNSKARALLHQQVFTNRLNDSFRSGLFSKDEDNTPYESLGLDEFSLLNATQLCNLFYFVVFPFDLEGVTPDSDLDIKFAYNGTGWEDFGDGPFFIPPTIAPDFFPEDSLQMFVGTNESTPPGRLQKDRDMILIGPNTQTYATFRPVIVYGSDRYDISSSTTNFRDDVFTLFGYWLKYRIFYNYVRFVTDEYYRESTYPASQWIVDLTGYATLFTGASLFSLLLLPLLRTMRKREKQRLLKQKPEVYLWSKHRRKVDAESGDAARSPATAVSRGIEDDGLLKTNSVMLPGYNV